LIGVGPARPAPDLSRIEIARIRQRRPKQSLTPSDVDSMTIRSDPLGPPSSAYPVAEYHLPIADPDDIIDTVRIEKLALKPLPPQPSPVISPLKAASPAPLSSSSPSSPSPENNIDNGKPLTYDAAVQFAIAGRSWPLRLSYDVAFVAAHPCMRGPHPLFDDYVYHAVPVDEILSIKNWGGVNVQAGGTSSKNSETGPGSGQNLGSSGVASEGPKVVDEREENERERVLVVEAFGVADNEVLARAWCSHWGLGAVIADVESTCIACAIREAYAACLNVVVLVDERNYDLE